MASQRPHHNTIDDVARRAGVSISTVSRVINRNVPVSEEVVARVQAAMAELKYAPRSAARNLASRKTNTLGLLLTDIRGDFFAPLLSGVEAATSELGLDLLISTSGRREPRSEFPRTLGPHNTDGLLIFTDSLGKEGIEHCLELAFPIVLIHQSMPHTMGIPCVTVENKAASRKIVEHLIAGHGRRHIVFLRGPQGNEDSYWREIGYQEALESHHITIDPRLVARGDFDRTVAGRSIAELLRLGIEFDAVFAGDDEAAVGVLMALQAAGKRVPEDIAVVAFDDQRFSAYLNPPLTTVRSPTERVGYEAAQQLVRLIRMGQADLLTLLPTELVIRRSCGCQA
jgi:LacI family transcriptional regulator